MKSEEEVKKILFEGYLTDIAAEKICHLFPKSPDNPDGYEVTDTGRLLTDEEINKVEDEWLHTAWNDDNEPPRMVAKAQDAKTASLKDAEIAELTRKGEQLCQQNGELLLRELEWKRHEQDELSKQDILYNKLLEDYKRVKSDRVRLIDKLKEYEET